MHDCGRPHYVAARFFLARCFGTFSTTDRAYLKIKEQAAPVGGVGAADGEPGLARRLGSEAGNMRLTPMTNAEC